MTIDHARRSALAVEQDLQLGHLFARPGTRRLLDAGRPVGLDDDVRRLIGRKAFRRERCTLHRLPLGRHRLIGQLGCGRKRVLAIAVAVIRIGRFRRGLTQLQIALLVAAQPRHVFGVVVVVALTPRRLVFAHRPGGLDRQDLTRIGVDDHPPAAAIVVDFDVAVLGEPHRRLRDCATVRAGLPRTGCGNEPGRDCQTEKRRADHGSLFDLQPGARQPGRSVIR